MNISIGCDEIGMELKKQICKMLQDMGHLVEDFGVFPGETTDYPETGYLVANAVARGLYERGILICGTGIGMAITANKVHGIRAAVCHDLYSTQRSILSNNVQIMCMGALVIGMATAMELTGVWMGLTFAEGKSSMKIAKIMAIEER